MGRWPEDPKVEKLKSQAIFEIIMNSPNAKACKNHVRNFAHTKLMASKINSMRAAHTPKDSSIGIPNAFPETTVFAPLEPREL